MLVRYDTTLFLRAFSIVAIVSGHFDFFHVSGGAYFLIALAGYNFMRFLFPKCGFEQNRVEVDVGYGFLRPYYVFVLKIFLPTFLYLFLVYAILGKFYPAGLFMYSNFYGHAHTGGISYWFIEVLLQIYVLFSLVLLNGGARVRLAKNSYGFLFSATVIAYAVALFCQQLWDTEHLYNRLPHLLIYIFFAGALCYRSDTAKKRAATTALLTALCTSQVIRDFGGTFTFLYFGLLLTIWAREIPFPRVLFAPVKLIATSTLFIYLCHFQARSLLNKALVEPAPGLSVLFALLAGCVFSYLWKRGRRFFEPVSHGQGL